MKKELIVFMDPSLLPSLTDTDVLGVVPTALSSQSIILNVEHLFLRRFNAESSSHVCLNDDLTSYTQSLTAGNTGETG